MVLWEITLATAYWLGLRRTYRLALKLQRRLIAPKHPRIRDFMHRRTRNVFDVALTVHKEVQKRDLSAGRSVGNFILRFLDRARPSANISGTPGKIQNANVRKRLSVGSSPGDKDSATRHLPVTKSSESEMGSRDKHFFSQQQVYGAQIGQVVRNRISVGMGMGRMCPGVESAKSVSGIRTYFNVVPIWEKAGPAFPRSRLGLSAEKGVFRDDIAQWMVRKPVWKRTAV